jgi:hypothetical protein
MGRAAPGLGRSGRCVAPIGNPHRDLCGRVEGVTEKANGVGLHFLGHRFAAAASCLTEPRSKEERHAASIS